MQFSTHLAFRRAAPALLLLIAPVGAKAQKFEAPPSYNAAQIRWIDRVGENYTILTPVRSDGLMRNYVLTTPYGEVRAAGDAMLRMRLTELHAVALLEKVSGSDTYAKALVRAGLNPLKYTGKLIVDPLGTIKNTFSGVGAMFGRVSSGISNAGKSQDDAVGSLIGVTSERRILAATYGVDPYTDFPPLDAKLKQLSEAAALGGLTVSGALLVVPGAAGIVVSNLSTANTLNDVGIDELARKLYRFADSRSQPRAAQCDGRVARTERGVARQPQLHPDRHGRDGGRARQHARRYRKTGILRAGGKRRFALDRVFHAQAG